jgi:hypothetical protein
MKPLVQLLHTKKNVKKFKKKNLVQRNAKTLLKEVKEGMLTMSHKIE